MLQKSALTDWYERDVLRNRIRLTAKMTVPKRRWLAPAAMEDGAHEMIMIIVCGDSGAGDFFYQSAVSSEALIFPVLFLCLCACVLGFLCFLQGTLSLLILRCYNIFLLTLQLY